MIAIIDSQILLRLRPYPMRRHWLLNCCLHINLSCIFTLLLVLCQGFVLTFILS